MATHIPIRNNSKKNIAYFWCEDVEALVLALGLFSICKRVVQQPGKRIISAAKIHNLRPINK
jgi:hypothetical protein